MRDLIRMIENGLNGLLHMILNSIFSTKIWLQEFFYRTPENQNRFTTLSMIFYLDDDCEGYSVDATLYGVTDWQTITHALNQRYSLTLSDICTPEARLDVRYTVLGEHYHIVYQNGNMIYPPYTVEELTQFMNSSTAIVSIIHAERGDEELTELTREYGGPKGNFYQDKENIYIKGKWIYKTRSYDDLRVTDGECKEYSFPNEATLEFSSQFQSIPSLAMTRHEIMHPKLTSYDADSESTFDLSSSDEKEDYTEEQLEVEVEKIDEEIEDEVEDEEIAVEEVDEEIEDEDEDEDEEIVVEEIVDEDEEIAVEEVDEEIVVEEVDEDEEGEIIEGDGIAIYEEYESDGFSILEFHD